MLGRMALLGAMNNDPRAIYLDAGNTASYPGTGATWFDISGNGNNGTLIGSPTYNTGNNGTLTFNGSSQYVNIGSFFTYPSFTINLWVNAGSSQQNYANIFDNNHQLGSGFVLQQSANSTNNYDFYVIDGSGIISSAPLSLTSNAWTNVAITFTPINRVVIHVNGLAQSQGALAGGRTVVYSNQFLRLAAKLDNVRYWNGTISNFSVYNSVLTATEISANFNALRSRYGI